MSVVNFLEKIFIWNSLGMFFFTIWYIIWVLGFSLGFIVVIWVIIEFTMLFFFIRILNFLVGKIGVLLFIFCIVIWMLIGVRSGGIFRFTV